MRRFIQTMTMLALGGALLLGTGCNDPKQRIAMLEESNQSLLADLQRTRAELDRCRESNELCQRDIAAARGQINSLNTQLATMPEDVPEGWTAVPGGAMIAIEGSVLFDSGKAVVKSSGQNTLEDILVPLRSEYADKDVLVFGHTDDMPIRKSGWKDNYELSTQRSLAVVRWLKEHGVSPNRLVACGVGEYRPRVPNTSANNRAKNRRVEIFALDAEVKTAGR